MTAPPEHPPRIVVVAPGEPLDPLTWSGLSRHLVLALDRRGALAGAVNGRWRPIDLLEKASTFSRDRDVWRQRHGAMGSPVYPVTRAVTSWYSARRARRIDSRPDALLQVGARHDLTRVRGLQPRLRGACAGGNFAEFLERPDLAFPLGTSHFRRVLDFERRLYDGLDLIVCWSEWLRRSFVEDFGQDPDKVVAVGAGANLERVPDPPARDFSHPRLLFIGKHFVRKGGPQVLEAFKRVRAERADAELWLVGEDRPPLDHEQGVRYFGRIFRDTAEGEATMDRLYREATLLVMPSLYEPFGVVFLEAMAYRLPCIGADACAMPEIIGDGESGFVVPPGDVDGLAERLLALVNDPDRASAMGEAGYRRFLDRFNWDSVAERIVAEIAKRLVAR